MTLIEILVAVSILVAFLLPVYGLYMMNSRQQDYVRAWSNALDISSNVMERLLSDEVPFLSIDTQGFNPGPSTTIAKAANGRLQAGFKEEYASYNLKSILGASKGGDYRLDGDGDRIITKGGIDFKVLFWAGIYQPDKDSPSNKSSYKYNADPTRELTFSYYPNPWFDNNNDCAEDNDSHASLSARLNSVNSDSECAKSAGRPINPYRQRSGGVSEAEYYLGNAESNPMDDQFRPGFPVVAASNWSGEGMAAGNNTRDKEWNDSPDPSPTFNNLTQDSPYNPRYEDKEFHNFEDLDNDGVDDGALMKLIVGVKWIPRGWKMAETAKKYPELAQEYYLVSFKANLLTKDN